MLPEESCLKTRGPSVEAGGWWPPAMSSAIQHRHQGQPLNEACDSYLL